MEKRRGSTLLLGFLFLSLPASGQAVEQVTVEWIYSDEGENATKLPEFAWTSSGDLLLLDERESEAKRTFERVSADTGKRETAVDPAAALSSLKSMLGEENVPTALEWPDDLDASGRRALFTFADDLFILDLASSRFERLTSTPAKESAARLSPDGGKVAFVRDNDLFVYDLQNRSETRLTADGSKTILNGKLSWVYWEEIFDQDEVGYWWSPDSSAIAYLRSDESPVSEVVFPDFRPAVPRIVRQRYPKAGGANPLVRVGIVDAAGGVPVFVDREAVPYEYVMGAKWLPDGRRLAVQTTDRMQNRLDLYFVDRATAEASRILTETDEGWVNHHELQFLDDGKRFVWSSERDGFTHLYLYDDEGKLLNRLTDGEWSVRGPGSFYSAPLGSTFVDEEGGVVYFTALEKSSIERQLYRVRLDGNGFERVTIEDGVHVVEFNSDRSAYVDAHSGHCTLPSLSIRAVEGERKTVVATARGEVIEAFDWKCPELTTVPADDGFSLPVRLLKPKGFDPARKYPVIFYVYGGPSAPVVKDAWEYSFADNAAYDQILAREGFVVMSIDPRSATGISKKLENLVARKVWSDVELADLLAGVRWAKSQTWCDPQRVGIWGWSGGGMSTLLTMTRSTEIKAGIAVAPATDWHYYDTKFTETFMKTPAGNPEGYDHTSLVKRAKNLHGRLLLVHGTYDDNVHPQHSWAVVDELVAAGKQFDLMIYPMRKHVIEDRPARIHLFNMMIDFWKRNL